MQVLLLTQKQCLRLIFALPEGFIYYYMLKNTSLEIILQIMTTNHRLICVCAL
jgi:hypothetical protein